MVQASLAVHSLTAVVYVCSYEGMCIVSLKLEGGPMVVMVLRWYSQLMRLLMVAMPHLAYLG